jgi:cytidyltransferase-like protein
VVTIGVFDGVHRGHQELIGHAVKAGRTRGVPTVLMTFDPHPMEVVFPGSHPAQLNTLTRRAELVQELCIDVFLVMPFTTDFMKLTPDRYIHGCSSNTCTPSKWWSGRTSPSARRPQATSTRCARRANVRLCGARHVAGE